jgi:hypothetical protein
MAQGALDHRGLLDQRDQAERLIKQLFPETLLIPSGGCDSQENRGRAARLFARAF